MLYYNDLMRLVRGLPMRCPNCDSVLQYSIIFDKYCDEFVISVDCSDCEHGFDTICVDKVDQSDFAYNVFCFLNHS